MPSRFREWVIPGPELRQSNPEISSIFPIQLLDGGEVTNSDISLDAISGHYKIIQLKKGHRFSTDDLVLAWFASSTVGRVDRVCDLGSGIGSVATMLAWRLPGARIVSVEAQEVSYRLCLESTQINGLQDRWQARLGDLRDGRLFPADEKFDLVTGSPPYFPEGEGFFANHAQAISCRFEIRGDVDVYAERASTLLSPGGWFCFVFPVHQENFEARALAAIQKSDLVCVRRLNVIFKEGQEPFLGLFACQRKADLPPSILSSMPPLEPPLVIRSLLGETTAQYKVAKLAVGFPPT